MVLAAQSALSLVQQSNLGAPGRGRERDQERKHSWQACMAFELTEPSAACISATLRNRNQTRILSARARRRCRCQLRGEHRPRAAASWAVRAKAALARNARHPFRALRRMQFKSALGVCKRGGTHCHDAAPKRMKPPGPRSARTNTTRLKVDVEALVEQIWHRGVTPVADTNVLCSA